MRRATKIFCVTLLFYNLLTLRTQAQPAERDSLIAGAAYNTAIQQYHTFMTPEPGLFRGGEYVDYAYQIKEGHPFFNEDHMRKGTVMYNGIFYKDLLIIYDLVKDAVVINDPFRIFKIALINEEIDSFTIENHLFVRLTDSLNPSAPRVGFYEQLYKGRITLLKKEKKTVQEDISPTAVTKYIDYTVSYYLKKGNTYYPVNNKRSLFHALKDKSKEGRKFIRKNGLSLKNDKDNTLIKVSAWYDGQNQ